MPAHAAGVSDAVRPFVIAALALTAVLGTHLLNFGIDRLNVRPLDANWRWSWSHVVDILLLLAGFGAAVAGARREGPQRRAWRATAWILVLFFLDEASGAHALIDRVSFGKALYTPILLALVGCLWLLAARTAERVAVASGLLTLAVAFTMHIVGIPLLRPAGYYTWIYQIAVGIKEGTECGGLMLVVPALWRLSRRP
jgi:hypothetical protein